jgi:hypothetical protein
MLQIFSDIVEGETGTYRVAGVGCDVEGTEDDSNEVEDAIDIKDELPEAMTFPPMETAQQVRLWCG